MTESPAPDRWQQYNLTPKERDVLLLAIEGYSQREIAYKVGMREDRVGEHMRSLYGKVGVNSRAELLRTAAKLD